MPLRILARLIYFTTIFVLFGTVLLFFYWLSDYSQMEILILVGYPASFMAALFGGPYAGEWILHQINDKITICFGEAWHIDSNNRHVRWRLWESGWRKWFVYLTLGASALLFWIWLNY